MIKVKDIAEVIEGFAPKALQESYDNAGLQVGDPDMNVSAALLCLDVTEDILNEAIRRNCNLIISHHPLIFHGLKQVAGYDATQRIVIKAIRENIAIYSAHTNLDSAWNGVSHEIAATLGLSNLQVLEPRADNQETGLGVVGTCTPTPKLEFLRKVKEAFNVKALRFSDNSPQLVVRKAAVCGGSGASLIRNAIDAGADIFITGDVKYHDFTSFGQSIILADIGHYESEICSGKIFFRLLRENFPDIVLYFSDSQKNPIQIL